MGVEETNPRRPHFVVAGENSGAGAGDRRDCDGKAKKSIDEADLRISCFFAKICIE